MVSLFDLVFEPVNEQAAAELVIQAAKKRRKGLIATVNVDNVVTLHADPAVRDIYKEALYRFADGMPVVLLSRLVGTPLPARVTGADLLPNVAKLAAEHGVKLFLMGGQPSATEKAAAALTTRYPGLKVVGCYCPPFGFEHDAQESAAIVEMINKSSADILFIGVGAPKQEKWASAHLHELDIGPVLGVGAAIDFAAGLVKRPPRWMQRCGLEWFGRLLSEPGRLWQRYLIKDVAFLRLSINEFFRLKFKS